VTARIGRVHEPSWDAAKVIAEWPSRRASD
jgi:hypothetical protein